MNSDHKKFNNDGFLVIDGIDKDDVISITESFGKIRKDQREQQAFRLIKPQLKSESPPNTLSSRYGLDAFPYHTDVAHWQNPASHVMLYCENPPVSG